MSCNITSHSSRTNNSWLFAPSSLILANNYLPLNGALAVSVELSMIIQNNDEKIETFNRFLNEKLSNICSIKSDDSRLFKQILFVTFLDSLAASVFPNRSNKDRFIALIDRFSNWDKRNDICLLHLAKFCSVNSDPTLEKIRIYSHEQVKLLLSKKDGKGCITLDQLPNSNEIKEHWSQPSKDSKVEYQINDFKYSALLYKLRNSLVHQFQSKGTELGVYLPEYPFYQVVNKFTDNYGFQPTKVELVYPTVFIENLCNTILGNVMEYFKKGNINPFPHYYSGEYWLEGLNR
ncbi:MAG: hypothetical protein ACI9YH_004419 [Colwellia sp.]